MVFLGIHRVGSIYKSPAIYRFQTWNKYTLFILLNIIFKGKFWVPLGGYPSSCSLNFAPYCLIQPLYNPYIGGICWYISRVLSQGTQLFPLIFSHFVSLYMGWNLLVRVLFLRYIRLWNQNIWGPRDDPTFTTASLRSKIWPRPVRVWHPWHHRCESSDRQIRFDFCCPWFSSHTVDGSEIR